MSTVNSKLVRYKISLEEIMEGVRQNALNCTAAKSNRSILIKEFKDSLDLYEYFASLVDSVMTGTGISEAICRLVEMGLEAEDAAYVNDIAYEAIIELFVQVTSLLPPYVDKDFHHYLSEIGYEIELCEYVS